MAHAQSDLPYMMRHDVASSLVPNEGNRLLNPAHPDFQLITVLPVDAFKFDRRLV